MSIQRFIVCDGPGCAAGVAVNGDAPLRDMLPEGWCGFIIYPTAEDHHFCSPGCLVNFANDQLEATVEPVPVPPCEYCGSTVRVQTVRTRSELAVNMCEACLNKLDPKGAALGDLLEQIAREGK